MQRNAFARQQFRVDRLTKQGVPGMRTPPYRAGTASGTSTSRATASRRAAGRPRARQPAHLDEDAVGDPAASERGTGTSAVRRAEPLHRERGGRRPGRRKAIAARRRARTSALRRSTRCLRGFETQPRYVRRRDCRSSAARNPAARRRRRTAGRFARRAGAASSGTSWRISGGGAGRRCGRWRRSRPARTRSRARRMQQVAARAIRPVDVLENHEDGAMPFASRRQQGMNVVE